VHGWGEEVDFLSGPLTEPVGSRADRTDPGSADL